MKTTLSVLSVVLVTMTFNLGTTQWARAVDTTPALSPHPAEDLGCDFYNGKTNRIARVYNVTPISVQVIYEGDKGGRNIPRTELPPELKARYPYNADEATEYIKNQASQVTARNAVQKKAWLQRETELKASLESVKKQLDEKDRQIRAVTKEIRTLHTRELKKEKVDLLQQQDDLNASKTKLEQQLAQTRKQIDSLP